MPAPTSPILQLPDDLLGNIQRPGADDSARILPLQAKQKATRVACLDLNLTVHGASDAAIGHEQAAVERR